MFEKIASHAARRYRPCGNLAWQFACGKLTGDPVYRAVWAGPWLHAGGTLLDVGCGAGLMLALIASAGELETAGRAPRVEKLVGMETRSRVAEIARRALSGQAEIITADARCRVLPAAQTILVFDVLHMMPAADQDALMHTLVAALEPGGVLLLREADAGAGWRFQAVNLANRLKAVAKGYSSRGFHFRAADEWRVWLESCGLHVEVRAMGGGTPFANVLFAATKVSIASLAPIRPK